MLTNLLNWFTNNAGLINSALTEEKKFKTLQEAASYLLDTSDYYMQIACEEAQQLHERGEFKIKELED